MVWCMTKYMFSWRPICTWSLSCLSQSKTLFLEILLHRAEMKPELQGDLHKEGLVHLLEDTRLPIFTPSFVFFHFKDKEVTISDRHNSC